MQIQAFRCDNAKCKEVLIPGNAISLGRGGLKLLNSTNSDYQFEGILGKLDADTHWCIPCFVQSLPKDLKETFRQEIHRYI